MNTTKIALEASLKELLKKKPFDKITIADLTEDCGISRMAFYYHFKDIYDLVEWACVEDGKKALRDKKTYDTWQEGFAQIFEAVLENKPFIMNVYHSVRREKIESFLYKLTYQLIADVVEEKCSRDHLPETDKQFIADFYKYGFVGIMLDLSLIHISEPTRRTPISYAVFCLKKKKKTSPTDINTRQKKKIILKNTLQISK